MNMLRMISLCILFWVALMGIRTHAPAEGDLLFRMAWAVDSKTSKATEGQSAYVPLPPAGSQCWIGGDYYFIYGFEKRPKLGTAILKIQLYSKEGKRDTSLVITGNSGMPSMRGHHDSGDVPFKLNKKRDYLLPVNVVMPGEWEVRLTFTKDKQVIFTGGIHFDV